MTPSVHSPAVQERHETDASKARRHRIGGAFDRAAETPEKALQDAQAMADRLKREGRLQRAPGQ